MTNRLPIFIYHVTSYEVMKRIVDGNGIDPMYSQGKVNASWYVGKLKVTWAIAHVMQRHQYALQDIAVLTVKPKRGEIQKTSRNNVFYSKVTLTPIEMVSAAVWLDREERYVFIPKRTRRNPNYWSDFPG